MILKVENLNVFFKHSDEKKQILKDVSFELKEDICLGILGESGSGKSILWKAFTGLLDENFEVSGKVKFKEFDLLHLSKEEKRSLRGERITSIVQNPMSAFDPLFTIENHILETVKTNSKISKKEALEKACKVLEKLNIKNPKETIKKYPHELSGGMLQRVMIALAIFLKPCLVIADEPTTAIDSLNQVEVINLLKSLRSELKLSMIFISHDLHAISQIADELIVMSEGKILEHGKKEDILNKPTNEKSKYFVNTRLKLLEQFNACVKA